MANEKFIREAHAKFVNKHPHSAQMYQTLCSCMAKFINGSKAPEVVVGYERGQYYEYINK